MWGYSKGKCAKQAILILTNLLLVTPQRPVGLMRKALSPPFFWTPLAMNAENRILSLFPLPYILGLPKGSIYLHVHILWRCPDMQHSETRVENLFTIMRHSHAAIPEAEDCLASFTRRSRSLWDDAAGAPISARFYWKETEWIWADRYPGNSSRIYSTSGKAGPFSLY